MPQPMIQITKATPEDMYDVADMIVRSFGEETTANIKELGDAKKKGSRFMFIARYIDSLKNREPYMCYVAKKNDEVIGASAGYTHSYQWGYQLWGTEDFWYVKKEHRSGRAGLLLYNKLMDWFEEMKVDKIQMMHYTWNPKVGEFYKRKGFVPFELSYVKNVKKEENGTSSR